MHVIGTAGHVDHGKSSLVAALTGTNPDRWAEERLRGMTLDLGFAHLRFEGGVEAGIVDVPGHERFLHNMLAGAAGMEVLLLVVAADEGVMPQTVEHLEILRFLNVRSVIVVLTKADLLDADDLAFARETIVESLAGTIAQHAPCVAVSTITGSGLDELRSRIHDAIAALPPRNPQAPAYLPIDRAFALPGLGTVVTGTLMQGTLSVGDPVRIEPSGKRARIRSLQRFGQSVDQAAGGSRVAVNVPGVDAAEIERGEVLAAPQFSAANNFSVTFEALPDALPMLRRRTPVRAHIGSAERLGTLVFTERPESAQPVRAQLFLRKGAVAYPGTAFVLRRMSPKTLLGGGRIESVSGDDHPALAPESTSENAVLAVLRAAGLVALSVEAVASNANLMDEIARTTLESLVERGEAFRISRPTAYVDATSAAELFENVQSTIRSLLHTEPWSLGVTSIALSRVTRIDEPLLVRLLAALAEDGRLANRGGYYATLEHVPKLSAAQRAFFDAEIPIDPISPLAPVSLAEVAARVKRSRIEGIGKAFDTLLGRGILVKVGESLYRGTQIAQIHAKVDALLRADRQMTMAQFRDAIGTSRKYAVPLLEWFDARGITVRSGDYRMLRSRKSV